MNEPQEFSTLADLRYARWPFVWPSPRDVELALREIEIACLREEIANMPEDSDQSEQQ